MKNTTHSDYIKRLENFIKEVETTREEAKSIIPVNDFYIGSLGGQLTVLKRELEYFKTHKITQR